MGETSRSPGEGRPRGNRLRVGWGSGLLLALMWGQAAAGTVDGRAGVEMEYLGDSYRSTYTFTAEDLGLPAGTSLLLTGSTAFSEDTWLPGGFLELAYRDGDRRRFEATSRTAHNAERTTQEIDCTFVTAPAGESRWRLRAGGAIRDDDRSLVGHGDWEGRAELRRETVLGNDLGTVEVRWEHARTRGDTVSYLYDYDLVRARVGLRPAGWFPRWEGYVEGGLKAVPAGEPGSYAEIRAGGILHRDGDGRLSLEARYRDVDSVSVGRDRLEVEGGFSSSSGSEGRGRWGVTGNVLWTDAAGQDDLTFDSLLGEFGVPWRWGESFTVEAGPVVTALRDLDGGDRDYLQGTVRTGVSALGATGGLVDVTVQGGYRNYLHDDARVIEITSLSSSIVRTDYWLLDTLGIVHRPVGGGTSLDLTVSWSWEYHPREDERIQVAFATVGASRLF